MLFYDTKLTATKNPAECIERKKKRIKVANRHGIDGHSNKFEWTMGCYWVDLFFRAYHLYHQYAKLSAHKHDLVKPKFNNL